MLEYTYQIKKLKKYFLLEDGTIKWVDDKKDAISFNDAQVAYTNASNLARHFGAMIVVRNETDAYTGESVEKAIKIFTKPGN